MPVQDIDFLKSLFQNGDTPDENAFIDWLDTMFHNAPAYSPLIINMRGAMLVDLNDPKSNLDFQVDISVSPSFSSILFSASTLTDSSNWEYWNYEKMMSMPLTGLPPSYQNSDLSQDTALVTYTWDNAARGIAYYVRARSGIGGIWGDYRVFKLTA